MSDCDNAVKKLGKWDREDSIRRANEQAIKAVSKLRPGNNYFPPDEFRLIVSYLLDGDNTAARDKAIRTGVFTPPFSSGVRRVDIVRVKFLNKDRLFSISDLAKELQLERTKLVRLLHRLNMPAQTYKNKKLYDIDMLRERLSDKSE